MVISVDMDEKLKFPYLKLSDDSQMGNIKSLLEMLKKKKE